jgi:hypothetical protein
VLAEESDESLATDNDSDCEIANMAIAETEEIFAEACAQLRFLDKGVSMGDDAAMPEHGIFVNRFTGKAHQAKATDAERAACGLWMNPVCFEHSMDDYMLIGCTLCWRSGCSQWIAKPEEEELPEDTFEAPAEEGGTPLPIDDGIVDA